MTACKFEILSPANLSNIPNSHGEKRLTHENLVVKKGRYFARIIIEFYRKNSIIIQYITFQKCQLFNEQNVLPLYCLLNVTSQRGKNKKSGPRAADTVAFSRYEV